MTDRSHSTDPRWDPANGGLPEPEPPPLSSRESRIADAEYDLMSAMRALLNATDWLHRAQANLRKARAS